jgi:hypothetical protein
MPLLDISLPSRPKAKDGADGAHGGNQESGGLPKMLPAIDPPRAILASLAAFGSAETPHAARPIEPETDCIGRIAQNLNGLAIVITCVVGP